MPTLEWNFNLGTIVSLIFMAGVFYALTKSDMKVLKENVVEIKATLKQQTETIQQIAVQKERLDNQERIMTATQAQQVLTDRRVYDLARGKGWIRGHGGVDGEYTD